MNSKLVKKEGCKVLYVLSKPYQADEIVKKDNTITGYVEGNPVWQFPNISNLNDFQLEEGEEFDTSEEDKKILHDLDIDFRLSKIEMGL